MHFVPNSFYHIYNRGNDKKLIFHSERNYIFFQKKLKVHLQDFCNIVAFCIMPNHFHLLVYVPEESQGLNKLPNQSQQVLARKLGTILSSYSQAINKQEGSVGSLFQQKTKAKLLENNQQAIICFHYIHQNPLKANLVNSFSDWPYSSFQEYINTDKIGICNKDIASDLLDVPKDPKRFSEISNGVVVNEFVISKLIYGN
jgi:Transposase and inactivated derivatives